MRTEPEHGTANSTAMSGTTNGAAPAGATVAGVVHHRARLNGTELHYVSAGDTGSPVVLVHGFPESWWVFHKLIPLLAERHQVHAVDLRGFGDSAVAQADDGSAVAAQDLADLIGALDLGPVHLTGQDISGQVTFRLAATRPDLVRSYTAIETGLPGFGLEALADVTRGGAWHVGVLAAPGIPEMLLAGRERAFIADYAVPAMSRTPDAFTPTDIDELVRTYARTGGFRGAAGLYRSMLRDGDEIREMTGEPVTVPIMAVAGGSGGLTHSTMRRVGSNVTAVTMDAIGHYVAMEAPEQLTDTLVRFHGELDRRADHQHRSN